MQAAISKNHTLSLNYESTTSPLTSQFTQDRASIESDGSHRPSRHLAVGNGLPAAHYSLESESPSLLVFPTSTSSCTSSPSSSALPTCSPPESSLIATLFNSPPFQSFTVFLLEASPSPFPDDGEGDGPVDGCYSPITSVVKDLDQPIVDPEAQEFRSGSGEAVVAGFVLCLPNYGLYIEGLQVRKCYRKNGFGKMLFSAMAALGAKMGYGNVDWLVLHRTADAIGFYNQMGAEVVQEYQICRLIRDALKAYEI